MSAAKRQMHLGVFVLGTGNHSAGWRYEGAATSHMQLPVIQEIARIAERGKFDLLFISDSMVMDPGDHPSFLCRFEPTTLITALAALHDAISASARRSRPASRSRSTSPASSARSTISAAAAPPGTSSPPPTRRRALNFGLRRAPRPRAALRARQRVRRCRQGSVGLLGGRRDRRRQGRPAAISTPTRSGRSTTRAASSRSRGRSTWRAARRGIRSSSRPAARPPVSNWRRAPPMSCSRSCRSWSRPRRPMPISRAAWRNTAARPTSSRYCPA